MKQKPALERAARALCELAGNPPGATMDGKPLWMSYLPEARAVLAAIREPTENMGFAANEATPIDTGAGFNCRVSTREAGLIWQAMINAALDD